MKNAVKFYSTLPNAKIIVDKFHVVKLLSPAILKERKKIAGTNATRKARRLLLVSSKKLDFFQRSNIRRYLERHPTLKELYDSKEMLHSLYRIKNPRQAARAMDSMIQLASMGQTPEVKKTGKDIKI